MLKETKHISVLVVWHMRLSVLCLFTHVAYLVIMLPCCHLINGARVHEKTQAIEASRNEEIQTHQEKVRRLRFFYVRPDTTLLSVLSLCCSCRFAWS